MKRQNKLDMTVKVRKYSIDCLFLFCLFVYLFAAISQPKLEQMSINLPL